MKRLKDLLRRLIIALPSGRAILRLRFRYLEYRLEHRRLAQIGNAERIFHHYYEVNEWGSNESVSGPGSTIAYTENIRKELPVLFNDLAVQTILDAPCGDYNWFRMIQWKRTFSYIGGDIVEPLIERNQSLYGGPNIKFIKIDIVHDILPPVDLWLCRDCLFHHSKHDIMLVIDNFIRSDIRYLLTTTHSDCAENKDIPTGSFRLLNLQLPPFSFSRPITMIYDGMEGPFVKNLALWDRETLRKSLAFNKAFRWTSLRRHLNIVLTSLLITSKWFIFV